MSDLTMLRKEIAIGFVVAGLVTELVPTWLWSDVFVHGHGFWTSLENALVGPLVALLSFVCSVGNVPLAAALWQGGTTFGGVVAFVFADLISLPLVLVYRKQYGGPMALRMLGAFWLTMSAAGLVTGYLFRSLGAVPRARPRVVAAGALGWNPTTAADLVALAAFAGLYVLYRNRERLGGGAGYAKDPVCGMQVERANAPATAEHHGRRVWFCSEHCRDRFVADPDRYAGADVGGGHGHGGGGHPVTGTVDPVCGMTVEPATAAAERTVGGVTHWFCSTGCAESFDAAAAALGDGG